MKLHLLVGVVVLFFVSSMLAYVVFGPAKDGAATAQAKYPGEPVTGEPVTTASGLVYYDIKVGDGASPEPTSTVKAHYTGWLQKNGKKFDSSADHGDGASEFQLNRVIPGWTEGVGSMKVGGKRKLIIPARLGYGPQGSPPAIPPNADLVFDIELVGVE